MRNLLSVFVVTASIASCSASGSAQSHDDRKIRLLNRTFVPAPEIQGDLRPGHHAFIQLTRIPTQEEFRQLDQAGFRLIEHVEGLTYIGTIRSSEPKRGDLVRWAGPIRPSDKLRSSLFATSGKTTARRIEVTITFHRDVAQSRIYGLFGSLKINGRTVSHGMWTATLSAEEITALSRRDEVRLIEPGPPPFMPLMDEIRLSLGIDAIQGITVANGAATYQGASGKDVTVGIIDGYVDRLHDDFWNHGPDGARTTSRIMVIVPSVPQPAIHGTHVASITAGNGYRSDKHSGQGLALKPYAYRGMAPAASLFVQEQYSAKLSDQFFSAINHMNSDVTNHSYALSCHSYDVWYEQLDNIIRGEQLTVDGALIERRPAIFAAGNNGFEVQYCSGIGYYSILNPAKNAIVVGATELHKSFGSRAEYSSMGPTQDGRIKPDVVAPGGNNTRVAIGLDVSRGLVGAFGGDNSYLTLSGTSMAAPVVTGLIALLVEEWRRGAPSVQPLPSSFKAVLINSADDLTDDYDLISRERWVADTGAPVRYGRGPDWATGYGAINATAAFNTVQEKRVVEGVIQAPGAPGPIFYLVDVPAGAASLKVTLAWDDVQGSAMAASQAAKLVNDLDLRLIGPDGKVFLPLTLPVPPQALVGPIDPIPAIQLVPAAPGSDHLNNVEQGVVDAPAPGRWTISISKFALPTGQDQPYSVASSAPFAQANEYAVPRKLPCGTVSWGSGVAPGIAVTATRGICLLVPVRKLCLLAQICAPCEFGRCRNISVRLKDDPRLRNARFVDRRTGAVTRSLKKSASIMVPANVDSRRLIELTFREPIEGLVSLPIVFSER